MGKTDVMQLQANTYIAMPVLSDQSLQVLSDFLRLPTSIPFWQLR